jgi:hypothetical protein
MAADTVLETDVFNGESGHAAKHNDGNRQVNWLTTQLSGRLADATIATLADARVAALAPEVSAVQEFVQRVELDAQDTHALFVTDSTGAYNQSTWTTLIPAALAAQWPKQSVVVHEWDHDADLTWDAPVTIQTGTGPHTIHLWMCGAPNEAWPYFLDPVRRTTIWEAAQYDQVLISLGHNDPAAANVVALRAQLDRAIMHIERMRRLAPRAMFALVSQNPTTVAGKFAEGHADGYRRICAETGIGWIDSTTPFVKYTGSITDLVPNGNLHPTAAGYALWAAAVLAHFRVRPTSRVTTAQSPPSLSIAGRSLLPRLAFPMASNGWTLSNVTEAAEAVIVDRRTAAAKLTKTATGSAASLWRAMPNEARGRTVLAVIHLYIPASAYTAGTAQIQVRLGGAVHRTAVLPSDVRDQYFDIAISGDIPAGAGASPNGGRIWINVDAQTGAQLPTIYVEDVDLFIGGYPRDAIWTS